jgi:cell division protein FtsL
MTDRVNDLDFEYAIRKDVRNNPIVREVDRARLRAMWTWAAAATVLALVALFSALQYSTIIQYGYQIERMQQMRAEEERLSRHLKLELAALRSPDRIARIATHELRLVPPGPGSTAVIDRVGPAAPPARVLVASR